MSYPFDGSPKWGFSSEETQKQIDAHVNSFERAVVVGWRKGSGLGLFEALDAKVTLVEAWSKNVDDFASSGVEAEAVHGTIEAMYHRLDPRSVLIWQHGPEHLPKDDALAVLDALNFYFDSVVFETPNGEFPQGALYGNPYEKHLSTWLPEDYDSTCRLWCYYSGTKNLIGVM